MALREHRECGRTKKAARAFTLVELAVLMAMTAILTALLIPAMTRAREQARLVTCQSNLKQLGIALGMYRADYNQRFPFHMATSSHPVYPEGWGVTWPAGKGRCFLHPYQVLAREGYLQIGWTDNRDRVRDSVLTCPADSRALHRISDRSSLIHCKWAHSMGGITVSYNSNYFLDMDVSNTSYRPWSPVMPQPSSVMLSMDYDWWNSSFAQAMVGGIRPWGRTSPPHRGNARAALDRHGGKGSNILWADLHVSFEDAFAWNSTKAFSREKPDGSGEYPSYHDSQYFYWPLGYGL